MSERDFKKEFEWCQKYAGYLLGRYSYTEKTLRFKLKTKEFALEIIDEVIKYYLEIEILSDLAYAKSYIARKSGRYARKRLVQELIYKGVSKDIINEAFENMSEEDEVDEYELAVSLLHKKLSSVRIDSAQLKDFHYKQRMRDKFLRYLASRGVSMSIAYKCIDEIVFGKSE